MVGIREHRSNGSNYLVVELALEYSELENLPEFLLGKSALAGFMVLRFFMIMGEDLPGNMDFREEVDFFIRGIDDLIKNFFVGVLLVMADVGLHCWFSVIIFLLLSFVVVVVEID
jgi:hypothetical protein